jgi:hypothetical protein
LKKNASVSFHWPINKLATCPCCTALVNSSRSWNISLNPTFRIAGVMISHASIACREATLVPDDQPLSVFPGVTSVAPVCSIAFSSSIFRRSCSSIVSTIPNGRPCSATAIGSARAKPRSRPKSYFKSFALKVLHATSYATVVCLAHFGPIHK